MDIHLLRSLFTVLLLGTAHMLVWKSLIGFGWPTLPMPIVDWLAAGAIVAQRDAAPVDWTRPTSGWVEGEVVSDPQPLALPGDLPAGSYRLLVGLYDAETLQRLGSPAGKDGRVDLTAVLVE